MLDYLQKRYVSYTAYLFNGFTHFMETYYKYLPDKLLFHVPKHSDFAAISVMFFAITEQLEFEVLCASKHIEIFKLSSDV